MAERTKAIQESIELEKKGFLSVATREHLKIYWFKFSRNIFSLVGLGIVILSVFFALFAEQIVPFPEHIGAYVDFGNAGIAPCAEHLFGTDVSGRDVFSRVIFCFRGALLMAVVVLAISVPVGTILGMLAGYFSGTWIDTLIMRITDIFIAIPALILALAIASILKPGMLGSMIAVCIMWWTWYARMAYGATRSVANEYFVKNAELIGASRLHILCKEILPNILSPILTKMALDVGWVILLGASLSYAGLGEQPPTPAFGTMISEGVKYLPDLWWIAVFPAIGIAVMILGFNFLGDGIRDMLDRGRQ